MSDLQEKAAGDADEEHPPPHRHERLSRAARGDREVEQGERIVPCPAAGPPDHVLR